MAKGVDLKSCDQLLLEIEELKIQLSQAEETVDAIRNGEVDAIIVSGDNGQKVFSIASSETPYRIIIEEMNEGAVTVSSAGTVLFSNQRFAEIISTPLEKILGSDFSDFIEPKDRWEFKKLLNASLQLKTRGVVSSLINNKKIDLQLSFVLLPQNMEGEICIVVSDITEINNYQQYLEEMVEERSSELMKVNRQLSDDIEKLRKAEEQLRELNASKDKFFSIITHDLKSPFTSIIGFSELLMEKIKAGDFSELNEFASIIHSSSWNAMDLLANLIEWSRFQTGRMDFNPENTDIANIIDEVVDLFINSAVQKSIKIIKEIPDSFMVKSDKAMISTILRNLISNAIKFTRTGGYITISAKQAKEELFISVSDNGVGIKKDSLSKLFRIGETISTKGTGNEEGTGLGLLLCNDFVMKHSGRIWVESESDKGSRFIFTLPL